MILESTKNLLHPLLPPTMLPSLLVPCLSVDHPSLVLLLDDLPLLPLLVLSQSLLQSLPLLLLLQKRPSQLADHLLLVLLLLLFCLLRLLLLLLLLLLRPQLLLRQLLLRHLHQSHPRDPISSNPNDQSHLKVLNLLLLLRLLLHQHLPQCQSQNLSLRLPSPQQQAVLCLLVVEALLSEDLDPPLPLLHLQSLILPPLPLLLPPELFLPLPLLRRSLPPLPSQLLQGQSLPPELPLLPQFLPPLPLQLLQSQKLPLLKRPVNPEDQLEQEEVVDCPFLVAATLDQCLRPDRCSPSKKMWALHPLRHLRSCRRVLLLLQTHRLPRLPLLSQDRLLVLSLFVVFPLPWLPLRSQHPNQLPLQLQLQLLSLHLNLNLQQQRNLNPLTNQNVCCSFFLSFFLSGQHST